MTLGRSLRKTSVIVRAAMAAGASIMILPEHRAWADPFFDLTVLGKDVTAGDSSFSNSLVVSAGDTIAFQIVGLMASIGTTNNNGHGSIDTLTVGTDGCNGLKFDIYQPTSDPIQTSFNSATLLNGWDLGSAHSGGNPSDRGNADNDLLNVRPIRLSFNYAGVDPTTLCTGTFTIASLGTGAPTTLKMRWTSTGAGTMKINGSAAFNINDTTESNGDPYVGFIPLSLSATAASNGSWNVNNPGNWSTPGNWSGSVPNGIGSSATFGPIINPARTVTLDSPRTLSTLNFTSPIAYTLSGSTLTLAGGSSAINVSTGAHVISAPLNLTANTSFAIAPATSGLTVSSLAATGITLTKSGAGFLNVSNVRAAGLHITGGKVHISPSGDAATSTSSLAALPTIAGSAMLDIDDNSMAINYSGSTPLAAVRTLIATGRGPAGFGNATWNGLGGITSSKASPASQGLGGIGNGVDPAIGYGENSAMPIASFTAFNGQTVNSSSILIKYTRGADATLDGVVDNSDVTVVGTEFNNPASGQWYLGDFDYSGTCDNSDVTALGTLFNPTAPPLSPAQLNAEFGSAFAQAFAAGQASAAVPEPTSLALMGLGAMAMFGPRRRKQGTLLRFER